MGKGSQARTPAAAAAKKTSNPSRAQPPSTELAGQVALLIGASTGIGFATARLLAQRGAHTCLVSHDAISLKAALQIAKTEGWGARAHAIEGDCSREKDIEKAVRKARQLADDHGATVRCLLTAAAMHPYGDALQTTPAVWRKTLDTNFTSAYLLAHYGLPHLIEAGGGTLTFIASVQGIACQQEVCAYASCKAALMGLVRSLAVDFGSRGVRANAICPGPVETPMLGLAARKFFPDLTERQAFDKFGKGVPVGRCATPEEIAELAAFVATERGSYCNGSSLVADGGLLARIGFY